MSVDTIDVISTPPFEWYDDIRFYLTHGYAPPTPNFKKHSTLILKETPYHFVDNVMFCNNYDGVFLRVLEKQGAGKILVDMHAGPVGGHFSRETTTHKVLRAGYYWPTLFKYAYKLVIKCDPFHRCARKLKKPAFPLQPVTVQYSFQ